MKRETIKVGQIIIDFLLEAADTNGSAAMFEFTVPVGAKVPIPHYHEHYDETIYGLEGTLTFTVDGKAIDIRPGETCFIPRGAVHGFDNLKQEDAKKIVKLIKDSGMKVQAAIMDDMVRVTGKKLDDLQAVIQLCKNASLGIPLQYENMRS